MSLSLINIETTLLKAVWTFDLVVLIYVFYHLI